LSVARKSEVPTTGEEGEERRGKRSTTKGGLVRSVRGSWPPCPDVKKKTEGEKRGLW